MTLLPKSPRGLRRIFRIKIKINLIWPALLVGLGCIVTVWRVLVVRQIWVDFNSTFSNAEVIKSQLAASLGGRSLAFLSEKEITKLLQNKFPEVSNVSIVRKWPTGVVAKVSSWMETLVIGTQAPYFLVNNQGLIFGVTDSKDSGTYLPLSITGDLQVGQTIDFKNLDSLVAISNFMKRENLAGKFTEIKEEGVVVTVGQTLVFLPLGEKVTSALNIFLQIHKNYQINGKPVKTIDVRFDNPVITE